MEELALSWRTGRKSARQLQKQHSHQNWSRSISFTQVNQAPGWQWRGRREICGRDGLDSKAQTRSCELCESTDLSERLKNAVDLVLGTQIIMIPAELHPLHSPSLTPGLNFLEHPQGKNWNATPSFSQTLQMAQTQPSGALILNPLHTTYHDMFPQI